MEKKTPSTKSHGVHWETGNRNGAILFLDMGWHCTACHHHSPPSRKRRPSLCSSRHYIVPSLKNLLIHCLGQSEPHVEQAIVNPGMNKFTSNIEDVPSPTMDHAGISYNPSPYFKISFGLTWMGCKFTRNNTSHWACVKQCHSMHHPRILQELHMNILISGSNNACPINSGFPCEMEVTRMDMEIPQKGHNLVTLVIYHHLLHLILLPK